MFCKPFFLTLVFILSICPAYATSAFETHSYVKDHVFYTEGSIDAVEWYDRGVAAMSDFGNYRLWAPRGIDGNDPASAKFWENFVDFQFEAPDVMVVVYNLSYTCPKRCYLQKQDIQYIIKKC